MESTAAPSFVPTGNKDVYRPSSSRPVPPAAPVDRQKFEELQAASQRLDTTTSTSEVNGAMEEVEKTKQGDAIDTVEGTATPAGSEGEELIKWLEHNNADSRKLALREYAPEVRGVHSKKVLVPGERILVIPKKCLITVEMGKMTEIGQKLLAHNLEFVAPKHIFLMMFLLTDMERIEESFYRPYYNTLPKTLQNMPIFWSDDELSWLTGSYIIQQIQERKAAIRKDYDAICRVDPTFSRFSLERFSWARMIVCSRNFGLTIDGIKTAALVPFADMLNHYRPRETSWTFDQSLDAFTITSLGTISAGSQVYDSYGRKCNHRFLLNYGFAVEDNTEEDGRNPNEVMMDLQLNPSDGQLFYDKRAYLHESGIYTMDARLSRSHSDPNTREGFSFARLIVATEDEFSIMKMKSPAHSSPPISFENEVRALHYLKTLMTHQLGLYETTIEEDNAILASKEYPLFSNRIQALFFIRGEKEVCRHFQELADKVIPLFSLPIPECKEELRRNFDGDDDICRYAQDVIAYLVTQVYKES
ncbi:hypothetical protein Poli38472_007605 [Pythium oligandrum]|uniref:Rubisco LSMT substrate-binding domain-containing protein n=1 Tax=Pythium oligandrum TaxID=41045 RepID=A0A8K1FRU8_PYTOL|nr:hypothetical protein Poli38472_007605 [Pythium oligandrum]|eukprot:TMW67933.1 hypothetical protein Poli38472_007605 [Pythium oligandrum]